MMQMWFDRGGHPDQFARVAPSFLYPPAPARRASAIAFPWLETCIVSKIIEAKVNVSGLVMAVKLRWDSCLR